MPEDAVETFLTHFTYKRGVIFIDGWQRLKKGEAGDCDDFAITIARILSGNFMMFLWNILTLRAQFWLVKSLDNTLLPTSCGALLEGPRVDRQHKAGVERNASASFEKVTPPVALGAS